LKNTLPEKPSALKREHPSLQKMKIQSFLLFFGVTFALLDPDPAAQINADPCETLYLSLLYYIVVARAGCANHQEAPV
jgi:hypothetical protein